MAVRRSIRLCFETRKRKKTRSEACKISGKMKLATTVLMWWLFDMQKAKKKPRRSGARFIRNIQHNSYLLLYIP